LRFFLRTVGLAKDKSTQRERVKMAGSDHAYNNDTGQNKEANPLSVKSRGKGYFFFAAVAVGSILWVIGSLL
jgi:hypothetical protein